MQKFVVLLMVFCARIAARPQESAATVLKFDQQEYDPEAGSYSYSFETSNGIERSEEGLIQFPGTADEEKVISGSYSYTSPEGTLITVTYTADKNGFHPKIMQGPLLAPAGAQGAPTSGGGAAFAGPVNRIISPAALASLSGGGLG